MSFTCRDYKELSQTETSQIKNSSKKSGETTNERENLEVSNVNLCVLSSPLLRISEHVNKFKFCLDNYKLPRPNLSQIPGIRFRDESTTTNSNETFGSIPQSQIFSGKSFVDSEEVEDKDQCVLSQSTLESIDSQAKYEGLTEEEVLLRYKRIANSKTSINIDAINLTGDPSFEELLKLEAFQSHAHDFTIPKDCAWYYMNKSELKIFLKQKSKRARIRIIDEKIGNGYPKGIGRILIIELILTVSNFCKQSNFDLEKSGTVLSTFYLTHVYFTHSLHLTADMVYDYFKEFIFMHSVKNPPKTVQMLTFKDCKAILRLFLNVYLRNLPLIKFLSLPNYAFYLDYEKVTKANEQEKSDLAKAKKASKHGDKKEKGKKKGKKDGKSKKGKGSKKGKK